MTHPTPICQEGFVLDHTTHKCTTEIRTEALIKCPENFLLIDEQCIKEVLYESSLVCPTGYNDTSHVCERDMFTPIIELCEEGYQMQGDSCLKELIEPKSKFCPEGYEYREDQGKNSLGTCYLRILADMIKVCPYEFSYDIATNECYKNEVSYDLVNNTTTTTTTDEEALLDMDVPEPPPSIPDIEDTLPMEAPQTAQAPTMVTFIQQPVPIMQPQVILPRRNPPPRVKERPVIPMPYPQPYPVYTHRSQTTIVEEVPEKKHKKKGKKKHHH